MSFYYLLWHMVCIMQNFRKLKTRYKILKEIKNIYDSYTAGKPGQHRLQRT